MRVVLMANIGAPDVAAAVHRQETRRDPVFSQFAPEVRAVMRGAAPTPIADPLRLRMTFRYVAFSSMVARALGDWDKARARARCGRVRARV
jgi:hypothetical protein